MTTVRSWLYVPANRPELFAKALAGPADAVVVDLEDSVPAGEKDRARAAAAELVAGPADRPVWVRVNATDSPWGRADVDAVARPGLAGVRVPKCESAATVRAVAGWLDAAGCAAALHPLLETALGVERAYEIARASPRVAHIGLGEADLRADLRVHDDAALAYARARTVTAARAAGLPGPVMSVHTRLRDAAGLRSDTRAGRALGFFGRSAIHPEQVAVINEVFTPAPAEVAEARELLAGLRTAVAAGRATLVTGDARFVDPAIVAAARWVLRAAGEPEDITEAPLPRGEDT